MKAERKKELKALLERCSEKPVPAKFHPRTWRNSDGAIILEGSFRNDADEKLFCTGRAWLEELLGEYDFVEGELEKTDEELIEQKAIVATLTTEQETLRAKLAAIKKKALASE